MGAPSWNRVKEVIEAALDRAPDERGAFVLRTCGDDGALRAEVESLLAAIEQAGTFIDRPALHSLAPSAALATRGMLDAGRRALEPGDSLGPHRILEFVGAGGMGEVYRARDSRLNRDVALKVLPEAFAPDPGRLARFKREAQALASLNHPNIAAIYGLEVSESGPALVLELVEGPTLANRIARAPVAVDEALTIAKQIAEGLEAAHSQGIVHRDLKPANIKLRPDGMVKILDFGLAKALDPVEAGSVISDASPIMSPVMTRSGVIIGTAAYMSPEQARGKAVDKRTDIWAFGCLLYEMLTGVQPFGGDGVAEVLANVIKAEPDWTALPVDTPRALRVCLRRCLHKDPRERIHDIADVRLAMDGAFELPSDDIDYGRLARPSRTRVAYAVWAAAALGISAAVVAVVMSAGRAPAELPETRLEIVTGRTDSPASLAISPDGRGVVFQASQGPPRLWLRLLESDQARPLMGTEGGQQPFWSPDSRSVGFFADGVLKRIDLASGFVRTLANAPQPRRGAWNRDSTILFGAASVGPLYRVSADSSVVTPATNLSPGQTSHRWPQFLPDGRRFLFFALGAADVRGVYLGSLADQSASRVSDRESAYAFLPPAHLLFARQGALWARSLNREYTRAEGEFLPVASKVLVGSTALGFGAFSASSAGSIAYRASAGEQQLVWLDRSGRSIAAVGQPDDTQIDVNDLSPDGRTVAVQRTVDGNMDAWLIDTGRGASRRLTFDPATDGELVFSPDGSRVVYATDGKADVYQMYEQPSDGTGGLNLLFESDENKNPQDWSSDGRYILYASQNSMTGSDLWALPLFGERKPIEVARTPFREFEGRFSPDGHWVAYESTETGRAEIYVQPFPGPGPKSQISVGGGAYPRWRRDGLELFYLAPGKQLMAVSIAQRGSVLGCGAAALPVHDADILEIRAFTRWSTVSREHSGFRCLADHHHPQLESSWPVDQAARRLFR